MESFTIKLHKVQQSILTTCMGTVRFHHAIYFEDWLASDAEEEFGDLYVATFKHEFRNIPLNELLRLWDLGHSIVYLLRALAYTSPPTSLESILSILNGYIAAQMDGILAEHPANSWQ